MGKLKVVNGVLTPIENTESREHKKEKTVGTNDIANRPSSSRSANFEVGIVDPQWELIDPIPDIFAMFVQFDERFFWKSLGRCEVKWSKKMTTCAGTCAYRGRFGSCVITLSEPLLKLRPRKDLVETMLHEMIHAYLFISESNQDRDGHGPNFQAHMHRINNETGTHITIYHSFHAEVAVYKQHWWRCDGSCRNDRPFYGWVKRAMNRAPGPNDRWWSQHQAKCNGKFVKVKEPEKPDKPSKSVQKRKSDEPDSAKPKAKKEPGQQSITKWFGGTGPIETPQSSNDSKPSTSNAISKEWTGGSGKLGGSHLPVSKKASGSSSTIPVSNTSSKPTPNPTETIFIDLTSTPATRDDDLDRAISMSLVDSRAKATTAASSVDDLDLAIAVSLSQASNSNGQTHSNFGRGQSAPVDVIILGNSPVSTPSSHKVACPSCGDRMPENVINAHLDRCLS